MTEKRVKVWVMRYADRPHLLLQWIDPDTNKRKNKSAGTADEKEAEAKRIDLEADLNNGRFQEASRMTWERFRELFEEEYYPNCRPETRKVFDNAFNHFEEICNPATLRGVTERTLSAFAAGMRKIPGRIDKAAASPWTVKVRLQFLRAALNWAAGQKLIPSCPACPEVKVPRKRPQPVPAESFEKLLAKAPDGQTRAYLLCCWLAGLRRNEALALRWQEAPGLPWLDFSKNRIWLPAEFTKGKEDQWVPLDPALREVLLALPRLGPCVFSFPSKVTGEPLTPNGVSLMVATLAKSAGVKLSIKSLRRGFGCRYAGKVPAQVLQRLMRHSDIKMTMTYYANIDEAVERAVLGPQGGQHNNLHNTAPLPNPSDPENAGASPEGGKPSKGAGQNPSGRPAG
jgi:integrase